MSTLPAAPFVVAPEATDDQRWAAWLARGKAHERLVNQGLVVAALAACAAIGGLFVTLVVG